ncbi:MAG: hypothetical protein ABJ007_10175 [Pseudophaeobacter sp.]|uniref:amino acid kinase family protein n=1 Tax=Pseudophaeobacter sp. TaxID=1971739 RepID=UPI0032977186
MTASAPVRCVLIKLGGAFFTDKKVPGKVHPERMRDFCRDLAKAIKTQLRPAGLSVILVSGGGSIGHHAARRFRVPLGAAECDLLQVFQMSEAMLTMKADLCREFMACGLPSFPFQEAALAYVNDTGAIELHSRPLMHSLHLSLLPVLSGGFVFDEALGVRPLNGDKLMAQLVGLPTLVVERAVFLSGQDGLLDIDSRPVPRLKGSDRDYARSLVRNFESSGVDVTGGMLAKLECCFAISRHGTEARILSGSNLGAEGLGQVLLGQTDRGTLFEPQTALRDINPVSRISLSHTE